mmetsp:Transcript_26998/g.49698  ORF Transcript_26998/g.49698 Transcript_26998/m.49698 type:complete len:373 (-) Transcript_26998:137-1255(-)
MGEIGGGGLRVVHVLDQVISLTDVLVGIFVPELLVLGVEAHEGEGHIVEEAIPVRAKTLVALFGTDGRPEVLEEDIDNSGTEVTALGELLDKSETRIDKGNHALAVVASGKGLLRVGVLATGAQHPVATEETVGNVHDPLLELPPGVLGTCLFIRVQGLLGRGSQKGGVETSHPAGELLLLHELRGNGQIGAGPEHLAAELEEGGEAGGFGGLGQKLLKDGEHGTKDQIDQIIQRLTVLLRTELVLATHDAKGVEGSMQKDGILLTQARKNLFDEARPLLREILVYNDLENLTQLSLNNVRSAKKSVKDIFTNNDLVFIRDRELGRSIRPRNVRRPAFLHKILQIDCSNLTNSKVDFGLRSNIQQFLRMPRE